MVSAREGPRSGERPRERSGGRARRSERGREEISPILDQVTEVGARLVYLDNAATSQKPNQVVDAHMFYYRTTTRTFIEGVHYLSSKATDAYELAVTEDCLLRQREDG